jgi:hypothetical protein
MRAESCGKDSTRLSEIDTVSDLLAKKYADLELSTTGNSAGF